MKFRKIIAGQWHHVRRRNYLMKCCDCGLVHRMNFRVRGSRIEIQAFRQSKRSRART